MMNGLPTIPREAVCSACGSFACALTGSSKCRHGAKPDRQVVINGEPIALPKREDPAELPRGARCSACRSEACAKTGLAHCRHGGRPAREILLPPASAPDETPKTMRKRRTS